MAENEVRKPTQKRSIETKDKIIEAGFELICNDGYHNTDTSKIAKKAGVSTGIVYQYFKNKRDIFLAGLDKYADSIFYPTFDISDIEFDKNNISKNIKDIIEKYINKHKLSAIAHEEIMSMTHSDKDVAFYFYKREMEMTNKVAEFLEKNGLSTNNLHEKVHIIIGLVDNLCHEVVYHKHSELNYDVMIDIVENEIVNILKTKGEIFQ